MTSFFKALERRSSSPGGMWNDDTLFTWSELCRRARRGADRFRHLSGRRLLVNGATAADYATVFSTAALLGCEAWLQRTDLAVSPEMARLGVHHGQWVTADGGSLETGRVLPGRIMVYTSGTTGPPRACAWEFEKLEKMVRSPSDKTLPWVSAYPVGSFAGLYTLVSTIVAARSLYLIHEITELADCLDIEGSLLCGTPTFWRYLLMRSQMQTLTNLRPAIISLGGEIVTQDLLNKLNRTFPGARIVHVYATTELGSLFSVSDRRSGFPLGLLGRNVGSGIVLEIESGELLARRANGLTMRTGDAVRISGDRVVFEGRADDIVNVAGSKVRSARVEEVIRELPFIVDVRVFPHPSPVTGSIVAAEIVVDPAQDADAARAGVRSYCATKLDRPAQPRRISVVGQLSTTATGKVARAFNT